MMIEPRTQAKQIAELKIEVHDLQTEYIRVNKSRVDLLTQSSNMAENIREIMTSLLELSAKVRDMYTHYVQYTEQFTAIEAKHLEQLPGAQSDESKNQIIDGRGDDRNSDNPS